MKTVNSSVSGKIAECTESRKRKAKKGLFFGTDVNHFSMSSIADSSFSMGLFPLEFKRASGKVAKTVWLNSGIVSGAEAKRPIS